MFGLNFSCVMCLPMRYCVSGTLADSLRLKAEKNRSTHIRVTQFGGWAEREKVASGIKAGINDGFGFTHHFLR